MGRMTRKIVFYQIIGALSVFQKNRVHFMANAWIEMNEHLSAFFIQKIGIPADERAIHHTRYPGASNSGI
jgi:hypothetical protein